MNIAQFVPQVLTALTQVPPLLLAMTVNSHFQELISAQIVQSATTVQIKLNLKELCVNLELMLQILDKLLALSALLTSNVHIQLLSLALISNIQTLEMVIVNTLTLNLQMMPKLNVQLVNIKLVAKKLAQLVQQDISVLVIHNFYQLNAFLELINLLQVKLLVLLVEQANTQDLEKKNVINVLKVTSVLIVQHYLRFAQEELTQQLVRLLARLAQLVTSAILDLLRQLQQIQLVLLDSIAQVQQPLLRVLVDLSAQLSNKHQTLAQVAQLVISVQLVRLLKNLAHREHIVQQDNLITLLKHAEMEVTNKIGVKHQTLIV